MTAYTDSLGFTKGTAAFPAKNSDAVTLVSVELDFAKIAAARAAAGVAALADTDTLEVLPVPAGCAVLAAGIQVTTVEGAAATVDLGDSGSATRFLSNANLNALGNTAAAAANVPYLYATASSLLLTIDSADVDTAVARVWALVANTNN